MNAADADLLRWLDRQIRTGKRVVEVPATLLENTSEEGMREARSLAALSGVTLRVRG